LTTSGASPPGKDYTFTLSAGTTIDLTLPLEAINLARGDTLTIIGNGDALDGENNQRGLFVYAAWEPAPGAAWTVESRSARAYADGRKITSSGRRARRRAPPPTNYNLVGE
jgi:hypothetical protein